jgi:hypothetical protein
MLVLYVVNGANNGGSEIVDLEKKATCTNAPNSPNLSAAGVGGLVNDNEIVVCGGGSPAVACYNLAGDQVATMNYDHNYGVIVAIGKYTA